MRQLHKTIWVNLTNILSRHKPDRSECILYDFIYLTFGNWQAMAGWLSWLEHRPVQQKVVISVPSQGTCLGCGFDPWLRHVGEIVSRLSLSWWCFLSISPSLSLSLPLSLSPPSLSLPLSLPFSPSKINKYISFGEDLKKQTKQRNVSWCWKFSVLLWWFPLWRRRGRDWEGATGRVLEW